MDQTDIVLNSTADICQQLLDRYSASSSVHHCHLCATAAAMRSILLDDSILLSPLSYFAATITAIARSSNDADSVSALTTFLSILLPLVPDGSIAPSKAVEAVEILGRVLERPSEVVSTSSVKCMVKCIGVLVGFCDLEDWDSVKLPVGTLLKFSMDKRPKVRKNSQLCLEKAFESFESPHVKKKASKLVLSLLKSYMPLAVKLGAAGTNRSKAEINPDSEHSEVVHVLNFVKFVVPHLSSKVRIKVVSKLLQLLDSHLSAFTRLILNTIEAFFGKSDIEVPSHVVEDVILGLSSYLAMKEIPRDMVMSAANLLKSAIEKLNAQETSKRLRNLQVAVSAIAGLLTFEDDIASHASNILKVLIYHNIETPKMPCSRSQPVNDEVTSVFETNAGMTSICSIFENLLRSSVGIPNVHILGALSVLFLKLGDSSYLFMPRIVLQLAEFMSDADGKTSHQDHLQKCFGCAIVAMGPENILSLVPISFNEENFTCSNIWVLPVLKKYIVGASLGYFMEHIVPISKSLKRASHKVKKSVIAKDLQAYARDLWDLLPAFCRYPTDIGLKFESLAKLFLTKLEKDTSTHEDIATALQELVKQNKCVVQSNDDAGEPAKHPNNLSLEDALMRTRSLSTYSKKIAGRNIKAMSSCSGRLLQVLANIFLSSTPEKRSSLKDAIRCLASISNSSVTKMILISSLERFELLNALNESGKFNLSNASPEVAPCNSISTNNVSPRCLILELASSLVEGADEDLISIIFRLAKHVLQAGDRVGLCEAYYTLSRILKEHSWFCSSQVDELADLLIGLKASADVNCLQNRLVTLGILLVNTLMSSLDVENTKAFLILNEIILALKDSKEELRKMAYDVLLQMSSSLRKSSCVNSDEPYSQMINMVIGYLSSSSPHMMSGAVSALSVLVYKEPDSCLSISDLVPSVLALLKSKSVEVIKAVLGFVKVLVSCLQAKDLQNFLSSIIGGVVPWSSVARHHFRSKVTVILEIVIRKCGSAAAESVTPEKYRAFLKNVLQNRRGKTTSQKTNSVDGEGKRGDSPANGRKRMQKNTDVEKNESLLRKRKRGKFYPDKKVHYTTGSGGGGAEFGNIGAKPYSLGKLNKGKGRDFDLIPRKRKMEQKNMRQNEAGNLRRPASIKKTGNRQKITKKIKRSNQ
ncbi:hypothetical protein Nepgr_022003 [Nepenthes gracilis]|uniref:RRP12-like protein n=1 Tax=Nepenthes gracilis TaxID=150966 RepID=A0AAD3T106_NEPGR|nr:hypothetical protein Nepgr_022003 [Nepenthes gracilis]